MFIYYNDNILVKNNFGYYTGLNVMKFLFYFFNKILLKCPKTFFVAVTTG